jgi:hippurate hydrolase
MASREKLLKLLPEMIRTHVQSLGCTAEIDDGDGITYPVSMNDAAATAIVRDVATAAGQRAQDIDLRGPIMFAEDFAFMLEEVPGCYFGIGNGPGKSLHDPGYDFNDELLIWGPAAFAAIAEKALPKA